MTQILAMDLSNSMILSFENRRFTPLTGLNLSNLGFIGSKETFHLTCTMFTANATINVLSKKGRQMIVIFWISCCNIAHAICKLNSSLVTSLIFPKNNEKPSLNCPKMPSIVLTKRKTPATTQPLWHPCFSPLDLFCGHLPVFLELRFRFSRRPRHLWQKAADHTVFCHA